MSGRTVTVHLLDEKTIWGGYRREDLDERFNIHPGEECIIKPVNVNKKKHRDRRCIVTGKSRRDLVQVKFIDTKKLGYIDVQDLVPCSYKSS